MDIFQLVRFVLIVGCSFLSSFAFGDDAEAKLTDYLFNAEFVQKRYDVSCLVTSTTEFPESRKIEPEAFVSYFRFTTSKDGRRYDGSVSNLNELLSPSSIRDEWCELNQNGKIWRAGEKKPSSASMIPLFCRIDPLSMFLLTVDSQANGEGACQSASIKFVESLKYVETLPSTEKDFECGVWMSTNRKVVFELGFARNAEMPSVFKHYYSVSGPLAEGEEKGGRYRTRLKLVSSAKVAWKKLGDEYVPLRAELIRGWKGGLYITQFWDFVEWRLGDDVDEARLDEEHFRTKVRLNESTTILRESIESKVNK